MTTTQKTIINTDKAPKAVGPYSQGVAVGDLFFFSGQIGLDAQTQELKQGFDAQLQQILKNIDGLLEAAHLTRKNIVKTSIFLTKMEDFPLVNSAYEKYFEQPYPARSTVEVSKLPKGAVVEIEVIAAK